VKASECRVVIVPRDDNANGARAKCAGLVELPVTASLVRLYSEYLHTEYGSIDSDYVFVNLWSAPIGRPLRYDAVATLVARLRVRTGIAFSPHTLRHSRATELVRSGTPIEVVSKMLTHRSVTTTNNTARYEVRVVPTGARLIEIHRDSRAPSGP
jgi:integrase